MTLKVTISHSSPGYAKRALVTQVDSKGVPQGLAQGCVAAYQRIVNDGESVDLYVHNGNSLLVEELEVETEEEKAKRLAAAATLS